MSTNFSYFSTFLVKQEMSTEIDFVMRGDAANVPQPAVAEVSGCLTYSFANTTQKYFTATPQG